MNNNVLEVDISTLKFAFDALTSKQQKSALSRAAAQTLKPLLQLTKQNLKLSKTNTGMPIRYGSVMKGIRLKRYKKAIGAGVNIMGNPLLHLFENGTVIRHNGSRSTGKITEQQFFFKANVSLRGQIENDFEQNVIDVIQKTFNKKYK